MKPSEFAPARNGVSAALLRETGCLEQSLESPCLQCSGASSDATDGETPHEELDYQCGEPKTDRVASDDAGEAGGGRDGGPFG